MAHNGSDPGEKEPLGLRPAKVRVDDGGVKWVRHLIDYSSRMGAGLPIRVVDIDGDGYLDVVAAGKSGLFIAENMTKNPHPAIPGKPAAQK